MHTSDKQIHPNPCLVKSNAVNQSLLKTNKQIRQQQSSHNSAPSKLYLCTKVFIHSLDMDFCQKNENPPSETVQKSVRHIGAFSAILECALDKMADENFLVNCMP